MRREHHSRCVGGQSVSSPVRIKHPSPTPSPSCSPRHDLCSGHCLFSAPYFPLVPPRTCAAPSSTPASWKRQVRARAEYSHLREPFGKVLNPRVLEALCTLCLRHRLHTDPPLIHQELVYISELKYHLPFMAKPSSLLISMSTLLFILS